MADAQLVFAYNGHAAVAKQLVVVKQASCYGVLYGHQAYDILLFPHALENLLEGVAADQLQVFALEVTVRGYVVEASLNTLYCYSSHLLS